MRLPTSTACPHRCAGVTASPRALFHGQCEAPPCPQVLGLTLAALMPSYRRHGALGVAAALPRMLLLLPPWLAVTWYVIALSVAVAIGAGALLGLQVSLPAPRVAEPAVPYVG